MLRPAVLLSIAREALQVSVSDESVANTDTVDRLVSEAEARKLDGDWNADAIEELLDRLQWEGPVQREVILQAAAAGGFIGRDTVYAIGEYPEERSLRGFTRPITRLTQGFRDSERVDESAVDLLEARYLSLTDNPSLGRWFALNSRVLPLVVAVIERNQGD